MTRLLATAVAGGIVSAAGAGGGVVRNTREEAPAHPPEVLHRIGDGGRHVAGAPETLLRRVIDLHTALRYEEAEIAARDLIRLVPDRGLPHYNLACVLARRHRPGAALEALGRAVEQGWRSVVQTRLDPDLEPLRRHAGYHDLLRRMRDLTAAEGLRGGPLRRDPAPAVIADLERLAPEVMERYDVPGMAIALLHEGTCVWTGVFGVADAASGGRVRPETRFSGIAATRLTTLLAAADLAAAGRLVVPVLGGGSSALPAPDVSFAVVRERPAADPGAALLRWPASSLAPGASADRARSRLRTEVVRAVSMSFEKWCRRRVLGPLGVQPNIGSHVVCPGHTRLGSPLLAGTGHAGVSIAVMARLAEGLLADDSPVASAEARGWLEEIGRRSVGRDAMSFFTDETPAGRRLQLAVLEGGSGALFRCYPEHGTGVVVLFNAETGREAALRLATAALGGW